MGIIAGIRNYTDRRNRASLSRQEDPPARSVEAAVDALIIRARRREAAGGQKDRWLFEFESGVEEISDAVRSLMVNGHKREGREIYRKLYAFAQETMADSYMPLYLYILHRYAESVLETGDSDGALVLFRELYAGTRRLIGDNNPYGIHCLEMVATAAVRSGRKKEADEALKKMREISREQFGEDSAMARAVESFSGRLCKEIA